MLCFGIDLGTVLLDDDGNEPDGGNELDWVTKEEQDNAHDIVEDYVLSEEETDSDEQPTKLLNKHQHQEMKHHRKSKGKRKNQKRGGFKSGK